tara:strand:- start:467 stop:1018 length:552 start_codon:yes stop_codon:yes gene_type:complete
MLNINNLEKLIIYDYTKKIQYVIMFFIFLIALSNNIFENILGCSIKKYTNNIFVKHMISILFLYMIIDITTKNDNNFYINPILTLLFSIFIYFLFIVLMNGNNIFILFILSLVLLLLVSNKYKSYLLQQVQDQEIKQQNIDFINKSNNVFVILIILTILIGSLTSIPYKNFKNLLYTNSNIKC